MRGASLLAILSAATVLALAGCGGSASDLDRGTLLEYVRKVEPIRLAVNRLLDEADPILRAYRERGPRAARAAARRFDALERRFAAYTVDIAAIEPRPRVLRRIHDVYAHTYFQEDAYLSALAAGLRSHELGDLPDTQAQQRAAIVEWRTRLMVLARRVHAMLPVDLEQAGRGEIAPSPGGS